MRAAATNERSVQAPPPTNSAHGSPERNAFAARLTSADGTGRFAVVAAIGPTSAPSLHDASAGRINVATPPARAATIASVASRPTSAARADDRIQRDTLPATLSMSE